ncbi:hypothetical protein NTE_00998 [Candidatus Nitrososphaera evergladensis SR1]|uniref:Uncharacterized protein n=1 Tax=Candidatus Nitrososphaera evergladensis SR1 TaxID=1459636 RepID=A0A075MQB2_9ARCH|nr:hypothetical protein NTE_00998 [Candidatus Nitrososphaera evergladensis SR1]
MPKVIGKKKKKTKNPRDKKTSEAASVATDMTSSTIASVSVCLRSTVFLRRKVI